MSLVYWPIRGKSPRFTFEQMEKDSTLERKTPPVLGFLIYCFIIALCFPKWPSTLSPSPHTPWRFEMEKSPHFSSGIALNNSVSVH
jgi:hypothetical protein